VTCQRPRAGRWELTSLDRFAESLGKPEGARVFEPGDRLPDGAEATLKEPSQEIGIYFLDMPSRCLLETHLRFRPDEVTAEGRS
jgi:hypothetical protein